MFIKSQIIFSNYASRKKIAGFSFVELMVALVANMILLAALLYIVSLTINNYRLVTNADTLNHELQIAMNIMTNDIRRAGYWSNASSDISLPQNLNPFMVSGTTDITVNSTNNCILFTYDHANNGVLPAISSSGDDDRYGYRLNNQTLQTRPPGATFACTATSSNWENVTNPNIINVTGLTFTLNTITVPVGASHPVISIRTVTISITGQLISNTTMTKTLTETVRVANDKFIP